MGFTVMEIEVENPSVPQETVKVELLTDSGAIYSVVPTPILKNSESGQLQSRNSTLRTVQKS
jgi:hypothetical protein